MAARDAELGCFAYRQDTNQFFYYPRIGAYDECQIDKSGRWLVIKENVDGANGEDNRIIDLETGTETRLLDQTAPPATPIPATGTWSRPTTGPARATASRSGNSGRVPCKAGSCTTRRRGRRSAPNHVSHANSTGTLTPEQQYACGSGANAANAPRANEVICFPFDGSMRVLIVAPVMTDMNASGGGDSYSKQPKGNLDVTGEYFIWTTNLGGNRLDAFIVRVPSQLLTGEPPPPTDTTAPSVSVTSPAAAARLRARSP